MSAAEWARRKAEGRCCTLGCRRKAAVGLLCRKHRMTQRARAKKSDSVVYWRQKAGGLCVRGGCQLPAAEDSSMCPTHHEQSKTQQRATYARSARRRRQVRLRESDHADRQRRLGLCLNCNDPAVTDTLCERHRREKRELWAAGHTEGRKLRCGFCREPGHNVVTCEGQRRYAVPALNIDHYAAARNTEAA